MSDLSESQVVLKPLMEEVEEEQGYMQGESECVHSQVHFPMQKSRRNTIVLHSSLILFYTTLFLVLVISVIHNDHKQVQLLPCLLPCHVGIAAILTTIVPARKALKNELRPFLTRLEDDNHFAGRPRPGLEEAWHDLLKNDNIQIPLEQMEQLHLTSIHIKDSKNVITSLSVHHALHCLKKTRQLVYREHYHNGKSEKTMRREAMHVDHCIEYIREYIMCHPDLSLITFHWINETSKFEPSVRMPTTWDHSLHECSNWEALDRWASERRFDLYQVHLLEQPKDGLAIV